MQVRRIAIVMAMFIGVCGAAFAQAPEAPPERVFPPQPKMEKVTFLGIAMRSLAREAGKKLGLAPGVGVKVDFAEKGSPAAKAGLKVGDVVTKLDAQIVVNPEQMTALVRMRKPGDKVKLTFVRNGAEQQVEAVLAQKEVPVQREPRGDDGPGFGDLEFNILKNVLKITKDGLRIEVTRDNEDRERVVIKDKDGKVIFDGPMPKGREELAQLPENVRNALKGLGGFGLGLDIQDARDAARKAREMMLKHMAQERADARGDGLTLVTADGLTVTKQKQPWVIVKDAEGKVLHDGLVTDARAFLDPEADPMPENVRLACDAALGISVRVPLNNAAIQPTVSFKMPDGLTVEKTDKFVYTVSKEDENVFDDVDGLLFKGPMPPDAEKAKLPDAVRKALDTAQNIQVLGDMPPGFQHRIERPGGPGAPFRMLLEKQGADAPRLPAPEQD